MSSRLVRIRLNGPRLCDGVRTFAAAGDPLIDASVNDRSAAPPTAEARKLRRSRCKPAEPTDAVGREGFLRTRMGLSEVELGPDRDDPGRIDHAMALVIVPLDVIEIHRRGDAWMLKNVADIAPQRRIVGYAPNVAFEMPVIDLIESDKRREQTNVGFSQSVADQKPL